MTDDRPVQVAYYYRIRWGHQAEFVEHVGKQNIVAHVRGALERAQQIRSRFSGIGEETAHDLEHARL